MTALLSLAWATLLALSIVRLDDNRHVRRAERDCRCRREMFDLDAQNVEPALLPPERVAKRLRLGGGHSVVCPIDNPQRVEAIYEVAERLQQAKGER